MNWFFCVISQKPFLEWEIERFIKTHPQTKNTIIKPSFYFAYDALQEQLLFEKPTEDNLFYKIIIGKGFISKSTGYSQADMNDWKQLLNYEILPNEIDGHYLAIKIKEDHFEVSNDALGHYPVYFAKSEGYCIASNHQEYVASVLSKKQWNYSAISALALLNIPLQKESFLKQINLLKTASTLKMKPNKMIVGNRDINFLNDQKIDSKNYLFVLKKAFELQLNDNDFVSIPFKNDYSSRLAVSIYCNKAKKSWGLYSQRSFNKQISDYPERYLDSLILNNLKIKNIPEINDLDDLLSLYNDYIMQTSLANFPMFFNLAGKFQQNMDKIEFNLLSDPSEFFFEKSPENAIDKLYNILKNNDFNQFIKAYSIENNFFRKEFYSFLFKGLKQHFKNASDSLIYTNSKYDLYHFYLSRYQMNLFTTGIAWLNNYRLFFSPGLFYNLICCHIYQRMYNPKIIDLSQDFYLELAPECKKFPKLKPNKFDIQTYPNKNLQYFPLISNEIGKFIEKAEKIPYYDFDKLIKTFKKAQKHNLKAINIILKWYSFEINRNFLE
ncbi:MAG: hypothetical protein PHY08_06510 [Candidatus Cloacimonetes bacterium]|jgi:hypothetical protein|nr:hypothetical protein [Candidatus Cloacimonadota bacterium]MDD4156208.1 hypothetical protein [Candidatus Cloacimonadota bacterium]